MVIETCNSTTEKVEAGESEFERAILSHTVSYKPTTVN